jgi:hypothetical protein
LGWVDRLCSFFCPKMSIWSSYSPKNLQTSAIAVRIFPDRLLQCTRSLIEISSYVFIYIYTLAHTHTHVCTETLATMIYSQFFEGTIISPDLIILVLSRSVCLSLSFFLSLTSPCQTLHSCFLSVWNISSLIILTLSQTLIFSFSDSFAFS